MRNYLFISNEEKQSIMQKHSTVYDGYATHSPQSNMTPLTVYDANQDKKGVTVNSRGEVKEYQNHRINEIAAKNLHYDEIDKAYEFDSKGPMDNNLGYNVYNQTLPPYDFDSKGPVDPYYGGGTQPGDKDSGSEKEEFSFDMKDFEEYLEKEKIETLSEGLDKTFDMFRRFKNYN
jgi:hypothetical protein